MTMILAKTFFSAVFGLAAVGAFARCVEIVQILQNEGFSFFNAYGLCIYSLAFLGLFALTVGMWL